MVSPPVGRGHINRPTAPPAGGATPSLAICRPWTSTLRDLDGSATGHVGSTVVKTLPMTTTDACLVKDSWMLSVCPHKYGRITLHTYDRSYRTSTKPIMTRDDRPQGGLLLDWETVASYPVIVGETGYSYILHFETGVPDKFHLAATAIDRDMTVRVGVCLPLDAEIDLLSTYPTWTNGIERWTQLDTLKALDATDLMTSYFWDREVGVIFFKFLHNKARTDYEEGLCPDGTCPLVRITLLSGDQTDGDCRERAYGPYVRSAPATVARRFTDVPLPATSEEPPEDFGAGSLYPFPGIEVIDGQGFGEWSEWLVCSQLCGGGVSTRSRGCSDPQGCSGPGFESVPCNEEECPEDTGEYTDWAAWSECSMSCDGGVKTRTRECTKQPCDEPTSQEAACNEQDCPIDGGVGEWGDWSACSRSCGGGERIRYRFCDNPAPDHGGRDCDVELTETEECGQQPCPIDGGVEDWSEWSECSVSCGGGSQTRIRACNSPSPAHGGRTCSDPLNEDQDCNTQECEDDVCETEAP